MPSPRLYSAVPTPLDGGLRIAPAPLARHGKRLLDQGCDGIVLFGTTGEGTFLSPDEKLSGLRSLCGEGLAAERIVLATGTSSLDDTVTMMRGAADAGCRAALVLPPFFTKPVTDDGLFDWFEALVARAGHAVPLLLYHIPAVAGVGFTPELALRLADRHGDTIAGVKDSSADSALAHALLGRGFPGIHVSTEVGLAANLAAGMQGTISASLNLTLPHVLRALAGAPDADRKVAAMRTHLARHSLIWAIKTALHAETGDASWERLAPPHRAPDIVDSRAFLETLRELEAVAVP